MEEGGEIVPDREVGDTRGGGEWGSERGAEGGGGGEHANGGAKGGVKRQLPLGLVDAGVVALQPWKPQHKLEMAKSGDLEGECLRVKPVYAKVGGEVVGDRAGGRNAAID